MANSKVTSAASSNRCSSPMPFTVYTMSRTFLSGKSSVRQRRSSCSAEYSMTPAEFKAYGIRLDGRPMRDVNEMHKQILSNTNDVNARKKYLEARWDSSPREKFYFPAATSWRYGWVPPTGDK